MRFSKIDSMVYVPPKDAGETKQVIVVRSDLKMVLGKEDAQVGHAARAFLTWRLKGMMSGTGYLSIKLSEAELLWINMSSKTVVLVAHSEEELLEIKANAEKAGLVVHAITDSGKTQFKGQPTLTCIGIGPDYTAKIDPITGHLKRR